MCEIWERPQFTGFCSPYFSKTDQSRWTGYDYASEHETVCDGHPFGGETGPKGSSNCPGKGDIYPENAGDADY